jgi:hypothetical protein
MGAYIAIMPSSPTLQDIERLNDSLNSAISDISNPRRRQSAQKTAYLLGSLNDPMLGISPEDLNREVAVRAMYSSLEGVALPAQTCSWPHIYPESVTTGMSIHTTISIANKLSLMKYLSCDPYSAQYNEDRSNPQLPRRFVPH